MSKDEFVENIVGHEDVVEKFKNGDYDFCDLIADVLGYRSKDGDSILTYEYDYEYENVFIGAHPSKMSEDETLRSFKQRVTDDLKSRISIDNVKDAKPVDLITGTSCDGYISLD